MGRLEAVELLIIRHQELAQAHADQANKHMNLAKDYEDYKYDLSRPGFKTRGWYRYAGKGRVEPYIVQAEGAMIGV